MKANNAYRILYESRRLTLKFFLKSDLTKTRKHSLKEIFFLSLIIFFLAPNPKAFALSGYSYSKTIPVYGSSSCKIAAGYVLPIRVCPDADPVQAGSWPVNGKLYSHRIAISVQEVSHKNLNDYLMWFEFHTDILIRRFYINKGFPAPAGNEFEFVDASAKSALLYNYAVAAFNGPRTRYFVQIDLAANQSKIVYFYFDPLQIHPSSNYRSTLVFSSTVPDNQYLPRINFPFLTLADIYLDGKGNDFPHDLAFTKSDGTSQLYYTDASETLKSDINNSILFLVRLADAINSGSADSIMIWYGNDSRTTRQPYWSAAKTHTTPSIWDDFESGTSKWITDGGAAITTASEQIPIFKGGRNGYARTPYVVKHDSVYHMYDQPYLDWGIFPEYGNAHWIWKLPGAAWDYSTGRDLNDFMYYHFQTFEDRPADAMGWMSVPRMYGTTVYMNSCVPDPFRDGLWWATYVNASGNTHPQDVFLASSTDLIHWTPSANNPLIRTGQGQPPNAGNIVGGGYLFWDADHSQWLMYTLPIIIGGNTNGMVYVWTRNGKSPDGPFTFHGVARTKDAGYIEEVQVIREGKTYYMFSGDLAGSPMNQRIRLATSTNPLGPFKDQGRISLPAPAFAYTLMGMPKLWKEGKTWNMIYFGQPQSPKGVDDTNLFDNMFGWASNSSLESNPLNGWVPNNVHRMLKFTSAGIAVIKGGSYTNASIYASIHLPYRSTYAGLIVRYMDKNNYYRVVFSCSDNSLKLIRRAAGTESTLKSVPLPWTLATAGTTYPLQVCTYEDKIIVKASQYGTYWYTYAWQDSALSNTGNMGVFDANGNVLVDDIAIDPYIYPEPSLSSIRN
jgi:hypothetical protein